MGIILAKLILLAVDLRDGAINKVEKVLTHKNQNETP